MLPTCSRKCCKYLNDAVPQSSRSSQAIKMMLDDPPDANVLVSMMPEASGLKVLRLFRADTDFSHIPVVVFSAKGTDPGISAGCAAAANLYLTKTVSYIDLCRAIRSVIDERR